MPTGYLSVDILRVVLLELKLFIKNCDTMILFAGRMILLKEVGRFFPQGKILYFKSRLSY